MAPRAPRFRWLVGPLHRYPARKRAVLERARQCIVKSLRLPVERASRLWITHTEEGKIPTHLGQPQDAKPLRRLPASTRAGTSCATIQYLDLAACARISCRGRQ